MEHDLEPNGWRQGSLVRTGDMSPLLGDLAESAPKDSVVVIVSQSCDIAQPIDTEPGVEVIVAEYIDSPDGNFTFAKNARILDLTLKEATDTLETGCETHVRLKAAKKLAVPKVRFVGLRPTTRKVIPRAAVSILAEWLAARYSRPAFPTAFNEALTAVDPGGKKLKRIAKRISRHVSGIYVQLHPDRDIRPGERYNVNLLGTILPSAKDRRDVVTQDIELVQRLMKEAGMEVASAVQAEDEVSIATKKSFRRIYLDDISFRNEDPLPAEVGDEHRTDTE